MLLPSLRSILYATVAAGTVAGAIQLDANDTSESLQF